MRFDFNEFNDKKIRNKRDSIGKPLAFDVADGIFNLTIICASVILKAHRIHRNQ